MPDFRDLMDPGTHTPRLGLRLGRSPHPGLRLGEQGAAAWRGSILDALLSGARVVVVPNPVLMNDHQAQLAEALRTPYRCVAWAAVGCLTPPPIWEGSTNGRFTLRAKIMEAKILGKCHNFPKIFPLIFPTSGLFRPRQTKDVKKSHQMQQTLSIVSGAL